MRTYVKDGSTVTLEPGPHRVVVTLREPGRAPHVSTQYGNPPKLMRSTGAALRADDWTAAD